MKFNNLIAPVRRKITQTYSRLRSDVRQKIQPRNIASSLANRSKNKSRSSANTQQIASIPRSEFKYSFAPLPNPYPQYECDRNNPLECDRALETLKIAPTAKFCSKCGFPAPLPMNKEIRGRRGIYRVKSWLSRQGNGRIYEAVQQNNGRSVIIKEYLLPRRYFDSAPTRLEKKDIFTRVANFQVAQTIPSDFRLIVPSEGIADRDRDRCYLIAPGNLAALPNLKTYLTKSTQASSYGEVLLTQQGRMETEQVLNLLDQVLQSLEFLHSHRWQFASGEIQQGLVHGNLSLDTLLINRTEVEFLVYLWDLSLWDDLFQPTNAPIANKKVADDLVALGNIGLYLLADPEIAKSSSYRSLPQQDLYWRGIASPLSGFLRRLLGINAPFDDAASARRELRQLISEGAELETAPQTASEPLSTVEKTPNWLFWAIFSAVVLLLGGGIWWWKRNLNPESSVAFSGESKIEDIRNVPAGSLTYGVVASSQLESIFEINDTYKNAYPQAADADSFINVIDEKQDIQLARQIFRDRQTSIDNISPRQIDFALVNLTQRGDRDKIDRDDGEQLINQTIAYDGLLIYVPFVDCSGQCDQLGEYLAQKLTIEQLRDIYTGKVSSWHEINSDIPKNIPIRAFAPEDSLTLKLFEQLLFDKLPEDREAFKSAVASGKIQRRASYPMLQEIRNLWQRENIGGIGFDLQSIIYKQCNVYPLSVVKNESEFFPMLIEPNQTGVDLFQDFSCKEKQDYQLNQTVFRDRQYPLAFSVNLLYLNDDRYQNLVFGTKIAKILQTKEFQCHLSHKKFIPLELSEKECKR